MKYEWNITPLVHMVNAKRERAFKKAGAFIRSDARHSIRVSKRNSKPGQPPLAKRRTFKNSIWFKGDPAGVVTGPIRQAPANSTPHILEAGGWRTDVLWKIRKRWEEANGKRRKPPKPKPGRPKLTPAQVAAIRRKKGQPLDTTKVTFYIAPRPYMGPAFKKNAPRIMTFFQ